MMPLAATPLQASLLREQVAGMLRSAIVEMRLEPGERITERQLVESTGVSRATVREAVRQLAAEGIVTAVPQRGVVVAAPSEKEARELYEVRAMLEGLAGRMFARRGSDEDVRRLQERFEEVQKTLLTSSDAREILAAKAHFYDVLFAGADNSAIATLLAPLQARITSLRAASMSRPGRGESSVIEIRAIVDAIVRRDEDAAFAACVHHVEQAAKHAFESLADEPGLVGIKKSARRPARPAR
jgi:GntR family transcriptional regulator, trigonelline degradation regulator